jgi:hypothetical protein
MSSGPGFFTRPCHNGPLLAAGMDGYNWQLAEAAAIIIVILNELIYVISNECEKF